MWFFFGWLLDYPTSRLQFSWMNVKMERMVTKNARFFVQENKEYWFDGKYLNCFRWVLDEESALELIDLKIKIWLKIFKKQINYFYQLFRSQNMPSTFQITIFNPQIFRFQKFQVKIFQIFSDSKNNSEPLEFQT